MSKICQPWRSPESYSMSQEINAALKERAAKETKVGNLIQQLKTKDFSHFGFSLFLYYLCQLR